MKRAAPKKGTRTWALKQPVVIEARDLFKQEVIGRDNGLCFLAGVIPHECGHELDAHHVLRVQTIWAHYSAMKLTAEQWATVLYDPDNGLTLCRHPAHENVTSRHWVINNEELPGHVRDYADRHALQHMLERECPPIKTQEPDDPFFEEAVK